jgi:hypothetical protein
VFIGSGEVDYGRRTMWSGDMTKLTTYARLGASRATLAGWIDLGLEQMRERMRPAEFARIARFYASNVLSIASRDFAPVKAEILYALAAKGGGNGRSSDEVLPHLTNLTTGAIDVCVFDDDHNSIVAASSAERLAGFLDRSVVEERIEANGCRRMT